MEGLGSYQASAGESPAYGRTRGDGGPVMKALPTRPDLRNWAETMSVGGLAGQAQRELDAVAAVVSAIKAREDHGHAWRSASQ